jgi:hypothetical protein
VTSLAVWLATLPPFGRMLEKHPKRRGAPQSKGKRAGRLALAVTGRKSMLGGREEPAFYDSTHVKGLDALFLIFCCRFFASHFRCARSRNRSKLGPFTWAMTPHNLLSAGPTGGPGLVPFA